MSEFLSHMGGVAMDRLHGSPLSRIINHLMGGQSGASGVQALVDKLRGGGLGETVDSWVGSGPNRPVQPAELERAIGPQEADRLAEGTGMERGGLMAILSQFLPRLVDGLTPNGRLPARDDELPGGGTGGLQGMLGGILGRLGGDQPGDQPGQTSAQPGGGGLQDMLGGLLNKLGIGGAAGSEAEAPRHPGMGAGGEAGMPRFGEAPLGGDRPASGAGGPPLPGSPIRRT